MLEFEKHLNDNLYKLWNRLTSGSYMPAAVRACEIPKADGTKRLLGIPTVADRIAQCVVKDYMEPVLEQVFLSSSYGYRPGRSAHQAIASCLEHCRQYAWVIDLDIKGYFDNIDHELLMQAVAHHFKEKWVLLYVERWLKAPMEQADGSRQARIKGTPQGGVISPLLSNLFLHYVLDAWLKVHYASVKFERYADDIVLHCNSRQEAEAMLVSIRERLKACKLMLNEEKTSIVYCQRESRKQRHDKVSFDFLGHQLKPMKKKRRDGKLFLSFGALISKRATSVITAELRKMQLHRKTGTALPQLAEELNPKLQGWINYFGRYGGSRFSFVLHRLNIRLCKWVRWRYKLRGSPRRVILKLKSFFLNTPRLFAHWRYGIRPIWA